MSYLKPGEFVRKYVTSPIDRLLTRPKHILPADFLLPVNSVIHFVGETDQTVGIDSSYPLIRNLNTPLYTYHVLSLVQVLGNAMPQRNNITGLIRRYHKTHLNVRPISNLDRTLSNNVAPVIINYALLPRLNKYTTSALTVYNEWFNTRATVWDMVRQIGTRRDQFLLYKLPQALPAKAEFTRFAHDFTASALGTFYSPEALNLLELWRMLSPDIDSQDMRISEEILDKVKLVFFDSGVLTIVQLSELLELATEDNAAAELTFYRFLDKLISLRTPVEINEGDIAHLDVPVADNAKIKQLIEEHAAAGLLSEAEQKGLMKLSQRYKTILDPKGSGLTLDQLKPTAEDLTIEQSAVMKPVEHIHTPTMVEAPVQAMDKKYIENVLHKDMVQTILALQPAGVIVKDVKFARKRTAVTKSETYAVSVQPINGPASTFHIVIPTLNPDGTFEAGGVRYRMDKQKNAVPIVKNKPDSVGLTSYYGKVFVTRNDSVAGSYAKWIQKEIVSHASGANAPLSDVIYGIYKPSKEKYPRPYTAINESVESFVLRYAYEGRLLTFKMGFNPAKLAETFTPQELQLAKDRAMVPCGRCVETNGILAMDDYGVVTMIELNGASVKEADLGTITYLIDPDMGDGPVEYTEISLINRRIPTILALTYMHGLDGALNKLGIKFTLSPTNVRLPYHLHEYKLKFKDIVYVIDISNIYNRILIGGFNSVKNEIGKYKGSDLNKPAIYNSLLSKLGVGNYHLRELKLMWDMFVDPITLGLLTEMGEQTTFQGLVLRASEMLVDDFVPDINSARYRGYERIAGMAYHQIVNAVRAHRSQGSIANVGVNINPNAVWLDIIQDQSIALVEESNPIHNLKEHESFTHAGAGGRSAVTMVKETRGFTQHDLGVISEATPDSAKVGIRAYLTNNPNFTSLRGTTRSFNHDTDSPLNAISTAAALSPGVVHDDGKRVKYL